MGFLYNKQAERKSTGPNIELVHQLECKACPLNKILENVNPHMKPSGDSNPMIYVLGQAPNKKEDKRGRPFLGMSGDLVRHRLPDDMPVRFNNVVRTRPPKNRAPAEIEIESCRPSIEKDIAKTQPKAIFGMGNAPLKWATNMTGIKAWRGRRIPIIVGGHPTWFYPMESPKFLLESRNEWSIKKGGNAIGSEFERMFDFDMKRAIYELEVGLPEPIIHTRKDVERGIQIFKGETGDLRAVRKLLEWAAKEYAIGVDYETFRLRPFYSDAKIMTAAIGNADMGFSFAMDHPGARWTKHERRDLDELWLEFLKSDVRKIVHNLPYEMIWTAVKYGLESIYNGPWECSLTQASTLDNRGGRDNEDKTKLGTKKGEGPLSLQFLVMQYFGIDLKGIYGKKLNQKALNRESLEKVLHYNAPDAKYHYQVWKAQKARLKDEGLMAAYKRSRERIMTCVGAQYLGMPHDPEATEELFQKYTRDLKRARKKIAKLPEYDKFRKQTGDKFDPINNNHALTMFRDVMKRKECKVWDKKKNDWKFSANKDVLAVIDHPLAKLVKKAKQAQHKISTYLFHNVDAEDKVMVWPDGMIHAQFNHGPSTNTHRLSSEDPNLQNQPKRDEGMKEVRKQIVAKAPPWSMKAKLKHSIVLIDYGQIEHRVFAMASKDRATIKSLIARDDVHGRYAKKIARVYPERIGGEKFLEDAKAMKSFRTDVKNQWTFPAFFGATLKSIAGYLKIPEEVIEPLFDEFHAEFKGIFDWQGSLRDFYHKHGYVQNLFGRRRVGPLSWNQIINTPIQGTAAELVMDAMNRLRQMAIDKNNLYFWPRVQVHDELQFILPDDNMDYYLKRILAVMVDMPFKFINVPITCELSLGPDLYNMKELVVASSDGIWEWHDKNKDDPKDTSKRDNIIRLTPKLYRATNLHNLKEAA